MQLLSSRIRFALCLAVSLTVLSVANAGDGLVSSMRMVKAVREVNGYHIVPVFEMSGVVYPGDEAPSQVFEVVRPDNGPVTFGRLYTSCSCIQLETPQRTYAAGERALLTLRNIKPTPHKGQVYQIYVQTTSPIRETLSYNVFVQSTRFLSTHGQPDVANAGAPQAGMVAQQPQAPISTAGGKVVHTLVDGSVIQELPNGTYVQITPGQPPIPVEVMATAPATATPAPVASSAVVTAGPVMPVTVGAEVEAQ